MADLCDAKHLRVYLVFKSNARMKDDNHLMLTFDIQDFGWDL